MKTNEIYVSNDGTGRDDVLREVEKYADYQELSGKARIHIRLLAEEMLGMIDSIGGDFFAYFWVEDIRGGYELHLESQLEMSNKKRDTFLSVSSSGKNAAAKGVMNKIRDVFQVYWTSYKESVRDSVNMEYNDYLMCGTYSMGAFNSSNAWSLSQYKTSIGSLKDEKVDDWDELEKSIIANLADDVSIGIRGDKLEMIVKKMTE